MLIIFGIVAAIGLIAAVIIDSFDPQLGKVIYLIIALFIVNTLLLIDNIRDEW